MIGVVASRRGHWPYVLRAVEDPIVAAVAAEYKRTPGQLLLRHSLQKGVGIIPSSANRERLRANTEVFDFDIRPAHMALLDALAHLTSPAQERGHSVYLSLQQITVQISFEV